LPAAAQRLDQADSGIHAQRPDIGLMYSFLVVAN